MSWAEVLGSLVGLGSTSTCLVSSSLWFAGVHVRLQPKQKPEIGKTVWFLVGNGGMGYGDHYWGLYRGYYSRDPFPHSLLSTRQKRAAC